MKPWRRRECPLPQAYAAEGGSRDRFREANEEKEPPGHDAGWLRYNIDVSTDILGSLYDNAADQIASSGRYDVQIPFASAFRGHALVSGGMLAFDIRPLLLRFTPLGTSLFSDLNAQDPHN